jgi:magnesium chelatase subunit I
METRCHRCHAQRRKAKPIERSVVAQVPVDITDVSSFLCTCPFGQHFRVWIDGMNRNTARRQWNRQLPGAAAKIEYVCRAAKLESFDEQTDDLLGIGVAVTRVVTCGPFEQARRRLWFRHGVVRSCAVLFYSVSPVMSLSGWKAGPTGRFGLLDRNPIIGFGHHSSIRPTATYSMHSPLNMPTTDRPTNLRDLRASGWKSKTIKREIQDNFLRMLRDGEELFPGIVGYDSTVIPEMDIALIAGHDMLFLGEKGQAKSRLMRLLVRFLDPEIPYIDVPEAPLHDDPFHPISNVGKRIIASRPEAEVPIGWWKREDRYAERLAPGTKFADIIGEIDPSKLAGGTSMSAEDALHFGLIPRMHRGIFAMNELPELDELVQVGLFNILEERDVQIRGYPIRFDIDLLLLFSANPSTFNRSGKVIPQLKDRIGSVIHTHYPRDREMGIQIMEQEAAVDFDGEFPVVVPYFMREIVEQATILARKSKYVDQQSGVSARFSIANYRTMVASARHRSVRLGEHPAVPRISDFGHLYSSSLGKLELDMMGSHQLSERQVLDAELADAVDRHGIEEIGQIFAEGVKIEVGDMLPSADYARRLQRVPPIWDKAFEVNASGDPAVRAACVEFVLAGLHAMDKISRSQHHGRIVYET